MSNFMRKYFCLSPIFNSLESIKTGSCFNMPTCYKYLPNSHLARRKPKHYYQVYI
jgi:hypothetical protein